MLGGQLEGGRTLTCMHCHGVVLVCAHCERGQRYCGESCRDEAQRVRSLDLGPRHTERSVLYRTVAGHLETWLAPAGAGQFDGQGDHHTPPAYVEQAFRKYLECGVFAHGFARVWCEGCAHDYLVAFACKGRRGCPSCNARRMDQTAAHLVDHALPPLPVRQWVLSVPKRLRYFMQRDGAALNTAPLHRCNRRQEPLFSGFESAVLISGCSVLR